MFKSLGKFFKKLFTGNSDPNATKFATKTVVHESSPKVLHSLRGSNGIKDYYTVTKEQKQLNKISRRRAKNKMARDSRNAQHKIAA